jgi:hypothetical protein
MEDYWSGPRIITMVFIRGKPKGQSRIRAEDAMLLALKVGESPRNQGTQVASRTYKRQGNKLKSRVSPKEHSPVKTLA